jgi:hypothetical protein
MPEKWIIRVAGKEYGPVDLDTLREWKSEGRVLVTNEVRKVDADLWTTAGQIPDLFAAVQSTSSGETAARSYSLREILVDTWWTYRKGFWQFLCLSALVVVPSICAQLSSAALGSPTNMEIDLRTFLAATFNLCMLLLSLAAWPLYIAGIQILTAELSAGRQIVIVDLIQRALKFWPRVAVLCVFVYGSYIFSTVLLFAALALALAAPSVLSAFFVLLVLTFWIWLIGRLWVNFLFWQQFAVLADSDFANALRQSKELVRSQRDLPWFRRPLWRGVFLASLWFAVVLLLNAGQIWSAVDFYFREMATATDPQALLRSMSEHAKLAGFSWLNFTLWLVQKILQPLLGIAFVLLYFDSIADSTERSE